MGTLNAYDRVQETTTTTGTGNLTLAGAPNGFRPFNKAMTVGDYAHVCIADEGGQYYLIGLAQFMAGGTLRRHGSWRLWYYDTGWAQWTSEDAASSYSLPAGTKRVSVVQGGPEAPVSTRVWAAESPKIDVDAGATDAIAWGRMARVNGGAGGVALGLYAQSNGGGVALGSQSTANAPWSIAVPYGKTESTARGAMALAGAVVLDGYQTMQGAYPARTEATAARSMAGWVTRGIQTVSTTPGLMRFFCDKLNAGYYYDLQIFGTRNSPAGGVFAGCYVGRLRAMLIGKNGAAPAIVHAAITDELRAGPYVGSVPTPTIAAGAAQDWTISVVGNSGEDWTWTATGWAVEGLFST